ncbi:MAG: UDP-N-acetylglucosamine 2-epimerase (non-hydrolyzing) [Flavobacteriales bacterium]|nr:UDP-N-acetylglucosamine 2-epimerase (non-hydrolyzing) [Flavobacteriales bacterium]
MMKIIAIIGARPQFIKHAPIEMYFKDKCDLITIHTGQHYDENMSQIFFSELKMSQPKYLLKSGGLSHGKQTAQMLVEIEEILIAEKPDAVLVYGDTNSTLSGALAASKIHIPIIHVEAGLRSFNKKMPEEINRVLTDYMSTVLLCPSDAAIENLSNENITNNVFKTGDVMCDMIHLAKTKGLLIENDDNYIYTTIHRPYNTDDHERLTSILTTLNNLNSKVIFSRHPRTKSYMLKYNLKDEAYKNIEFIEPASYFDNLNFLHNSTAMITDSGGMQKEAYILKKKCITIRSETEWMGTLKNGWNTLVFENLSEMESILNKPTGEHISNLYGNGKASQEIFEIIQKTLK